MNKIAICGAITLCLFFSPVPVLLAADPIPAPAEALKQDKLLIKTSTKPAVFTIEIAETPKQQEQGFMHRTDIPDDHGMLFIWPKDVPARMWMKDTPLSLDMLFIDHQGKIVFIENKTEPYSLKIIDPGYQVRAVLELSGGTSVAKGIHVGDHVIHSYFEP